jgi:hypothetical protein
MVMLTRRAAAPGCSATASAIACQWRSAIFCWNATIYRPHRLSGDIESKWTWVFSVDTFTVLAGTALMPSDRLRTPPAALNPFTCGV